MDFHPLSRLRKDPDKRPRFPGPFVSQRGFQRRHSAAVMGALSGGPLLDRTTASEVEQKFLSPVFEFTGVATAT